MLTMITAAAVYPNGVVCISILHPPGEDQLNQQETADERWRPILGVESILVSVISMLSDPNDDSPANIDAAVGWLDARGVAVCSVPCKLTLFLCWIIRSSGGMTRTASRSTAVASCASRRRISSQSAAPCSAARPAPEDEPTLMTTSFRHLTRAAAAPFACLKDDRRLGASQPTLRPRRRRNE
jgi:hypothetical protein